MSALKLTKLTKIRFEMDDGTYYQLTDPKEIAKWEAKIISQDISESNEPVKWEIGKIE